MHHLYEQNGVVDKEILNKEIIIYGCGNDGDKLYKILMKHEAKVKYFCDSNESKWGTLFHGILIIPPSELEKQMSCNLAMAFYRWTDVIGKISFFPDISIWADYSYQNEREGNCIFCKSSRLTSSGAHFAPFIVSRMFNNQKHDTDIVFCNNCGISYSSYRPSEEETNRHYNMYRTEEYNLERLRFESSYNIQQYSDISIIENRKTFVEQFLTLLVDVSKLNFILDYGGGNGQLFPDIFQGKEKYVYDISMCELVDGVKRTDLKDEISTKWDLIICSHMLEHVDDPMSMVRKMEALMRNNAYLYIEIPIEKYQNNYSNWEFNEHINFFGEETLCFVEKFTELKMIDKNIKNGIAQYLFEKI